MTDPRLEIEATPRTIPPGRDMDTSLFSFAWQTTQKRSEEIRRLKKGQQAAVEGENQAWITLADECFRLRKVYAALALAMDQSGLSRGAQDLALAIRHLEQALQFHDVEIVAPVGSLYSTEMSEVIESVEQVPRPNIEGPVVHEVLVPVIKRADQVIRFGKAIIAVPEQS